MNDIRELFATTEESEKQVHPIAYEELSVPASHSGTPPLVGTMNPLHKLKAQITVRVGGVQLTVGELMSLHDQQLLLLDRQLNAPVDVMLEGDVIAQGELVAVDDRFAVRVTRLPLPLKG
jgi:flagellar motor switch protein FliN/FliY